MNFHLFLCCEYMFSFHIILKSVFSPSRPIGEGIQYLYLHKLGDLLFFCTLISISIFFHIFLLQQPKPLWELPKQTKCAHVVEWNVRVFPYILIGALSTIFHYRREVSSAKKPWPVCRVIANKQKWKLQCFIIINEHERATWRFRIAASALAR